MKKLIVLVGVVLLATVLRTSVAAARGNVVGTYTVADLGQGIWGGGALMADGSVTGRVPVSFDNGQEVGMYVPTGWSALGPDAVLVCFEARIIKSAQGQEPFSFCAPLPVTGTPMHIDFDGDGNPDFILRLTLNH